MNTRPSNAAASPNPLAPLKHRAFALLWTATLITNIGTWMHDVSAAWLMTSLSPSPLVVAMVQAATSGAMALFALPAGAMADLFDRKRLLLTLVAFKASLAVLLGILTLLGIVSVVSLLTITFLLGVGSALMGPVWQSVVPTLVPRTDLKPAVATRGSYFRTMVAFRLLNAMTSTRVEAPPAVSWDATNLGRPAPSTCPRNAL